jgi:CRP/FNR family transcriptional regulator, cyclic AMP receptor protein
MFSRKKAEQQAAVDELTDVSFFEGFTPEELARVAELADEIEAEAGAELMDQGRPGLECYVILEGTAGVYFGGEHIASLEAGSMVGEMALIDHRPRSATVIAETPMRLLAFDTRAFRSLLDEMPKASQKVMSLLNARAQENAARQAD